MKKKDFITTEDIDPKFKAVNAFIFAGSFSIGVMKAGFDLQKVLEISDSQPEENAFFFIKNVEDVPVILPKTWENDKYLNNLKNENIDLMCCNCPCSSLSQINRNASVDGKNNVHFYRLFNIFKHVQPKVFVIENAPTLVKLGFPILKDLVRELGDKYRFSILRDFAMNHEVPMKRQRTMIVGWNRENFDSVPFINVDKHELVSVKDTLKDIYEDTTNDYPSKSYDEISHLYKFCKSNFPIMHSLATRIEENPDGKIAKEILDGLKDHPSKLREVNRIREKIRNNERFWNKSPTRPQEDCLFPSFTSVTEYLHPVQNRTLNKRELGRIMGYPDEYDFSNSDNICKIPVSQAIAQGVPVNFGKYIATQARLGLEGKLEMNSNKNIDIVFQHNSAYKYDEYTISEFNNLTFLDSSKSSKNLKK